MVFRFRSPLRTNLEESVAIVREGWRDTGQSAQRRRDIKGDRFGESRFEGWHVRCVLRRRHGDREEVARSQAQPESHCTLPESESCHRGSPLSRIKSWQVAQIVGLLQLIVNICF